MYIFHDHTQVVSVPRRTQILLCPTAPEHAISIIPNMSKTGEEKYKNRCNSIAHAHTSFVCNINTHTPETQTHGGEYKGFNGVAMHATMLNFVELFRA